MVCGAISSFTGPVPLFAGFSTILSKLSATFDDDDGIFFSLIIREIGLQKGTSLLGMKKKISATISYVLFNRSKNFVSSRL